MIDSSPHCPKRKKNVTRRFRVGFIPGFLKNASSHFSNIFKSALRKVKLGNNFLLIEA
jgi:hypothetical protein